MSTILNRQSEAKSLPAPRTLQRHRWEMRRLRGQAEALILSHRAVSLQGQDEQVEELASALGLAEHEFAALAVRLGTRNATLVCVPSRLWNLPEAMKLFFELKASAADRQNYVRLDRRQPFSPLSKMINRLGGAQ